MVAVVAVVAVGALAACTVHVDAPDLRGQDVRLTLLHTADIHSRLFPYQLAPGAIDRGLGLRPRHGELAVVGGIARIATVIRRERAASQRVLHLDSGDLFEGAPVFNTFAGEVEMRAMTRLGVNAMALGNHELDKGARNLALMKEAFGGFPILAANYLFADPADPGQPKLRRVLQPLALFNVQGLRVGVIGMGNLSSLQGLLEGGNPLGLRPLDARAALEDTVRLIRGQVDVVVVLSHLGLDEDEGVASAAAGSDDSPAVDGVDVILGGHLHVVLDPPRDLVRTSEQGDPSGHTVLCHSGAFARYVGRLDLSVHVADPAVPGDRPAVTAYTYKLVPIDDAIPEDADMANLLAPYQLRMARALDLGHGYAINPCPRGVASCPKVARADPGGGDSQLGNLVAASLRLRPRVQADFGLTNSLGIRGDFEAGLVDLEQAYSVFPFDNTITTLSLSGREIAALFDFVAARSAARGCKTQSQVSGVWLVIDCARRASCGPFDAEGRRATACHHLEAGYGEAGYAGARDGPYLLGDDCLADRGPCASDADCGAGAGAAGRAFCGAGGRCRRACAPVLPSGEYRVAVNDYIAAGGSGFALLARNTTRFNTGISLRDALLDHLAAQPNRCDALAFGNVAQVLCRGAAGKPPVDCTDTCCHDLPGASPYGGPGCDERSAAYQACEAMGLFAPAAGDPSAGRARLGIQFDHAGLPCLDATVEPHDGRISTVGGG